MLTRAELKIAMEQAGLSRVAGPLAALSEPCVLVKTLPHPNEAMTIGRSRIGGIPDLPAQLPWPTWRNEPLAFLAQINLEDLSTFPCCRELPPSGCLWFFYDYEQATWGFDPQDRGSWCVLYSPANSSELQPRENLALASHAIYQPCFLTFHDFLSIPGPEHLAVAPLEFTLEELEEIQEIDQDLLEMIDAGSHSLGYEPHHQILGHPKQIQGVMQVECQLAFHGVYCGGATRCQAADRELLEPGAKDWRLLFQLDSDDEPGMMWGDCGRLYFWIRQQDLAQRKFENVWMVLQCS